MTANSSLHIAEPKNFLRAESIVTRPKSSQIAHFEAKLTEFVRYVRQHSKEREEHYKNDVAHFLKTACGFEGYRVNTSNDIDLAIYEDGGERLEVLFEVKRPNNRTEMIAKGDFNRKAMQQLLYYFLGEVITKENHQIKHLIITDTLEWYVFDARQFYKVFVEKQQGKKGLVQQYKEFKQKEVLGDGTKYFYEQIAQPFLATLSEADFGDVAYFNLVDFVPEAEARSDSESAAAYSAELINLYKFLSPQHLLRQNAANDANDLDKNFYNELLYVMGLEEATEEGRPQIRRIKDAQQRQSSSLIELCLEMLDIDQVGNLELRGETREEQQFSVALELCTTWVNRVLFLKLLEGQLLNYHEGAEQHRYAFLTSAQISSFTELFHLFHNVLAKKHAERPEHLRNKFLRVPYLNSTLFEVSDLEKITLKVNSLDGERLLPLAKKSVLAKNGQEPVGRKTLAYLLDFLAAYDFGSDGSGQLTQDDNTPLINASVLGKIFEKLNGYKDGSIYTPSFVTMYMARESVHRLVLQKFNTYLRAENPKHRDITTLQELRNDGLRYINTVKANELINGLRICDPAVGSGHLLVSVLNELIAVKSELDILTDSEGNVLRGYKVEVANDDLVISNDKRQIFRYLPNNREALRVQKTIFEQKRQLIQGCLFGVDLNPNSAKICRLRLWVELLKNAYYINFHDCPKGSHPDLETLPNLDINIGEGNSILYQLPIRKEENIGKGNALIQSYIKTGKTSFFIYQTTDDKATRQAEELKIKQITQDIQAKIPKIHPDYEKLQKMEKELWEKKGAMFELSREQFAAIAEITEKIETLKAELKQLYANSFEWRTGFLPLLDDQTGEFVGFDLVIGNPPYIQLQKMHEFSANIKKLNSLSKGRTLYDTYTPTSDIYALFYELGVRLLRDGGFLCYITSNKWMRTNYGESLRRFFAEKTIPLLLIDFGNMKIFESATVDTNILFLQKPVNNKTISRPPMRALRLENKDLDIRKDSLFDFVKTNAYEMGSLNHNAWVVGKGDDFNIKQHVEKQGIPLKDWDLTINRGILTGYNDAFIIPEHTKNQLIAEKSNSAELLKPILQGKDIETWYPKWKNLWLIATFPSLKIDIEQYTAIKNYLLSIGKSRLEQDGKGRKKTGNKWFETQDKIGYWEDFQKPKIVYREITQNFDFLIDFDGKYYLLDTCWMMVGKNLSYLTCFFNSKLFRYCFADNFSDLGGHARRLKKVFFQKIPVKPIDASMELPYVRIVEYLTALKQLDLSDISDRMLPVYFEQIANGLIYEYYFEEAFASADFALHKHLRALPALEHTGDILAQMRLVFKELYQQTHPVRYALYHMSSIPQVNLIAQNTAW